MVYWGRSPIQTNRVRYEYNRPFLEAKDYQEDDALAVETTGSVIYSENTYSKSCVNCLFLSAYLKIHFGSEFMHIVQ